MKNFIQSFSHNCNSLRAPVVGAVLVFDTLDMYIMYCWECLECTLDWLLGWKISGGGLSACLYCLHFQHCPVMYSWHLIFLLRFNSRSILPFFFVVSWLLFTGTSRNSSDGRGSHLITTKSWSEPLKMWYNSNISLLTSPVKISCHHCSIHACAIMRSRVQ